MANRMTPPAEGQEKDVLLVLDKQQGKVSAVKGFDKEGNLQTVSPTAAPVSYTHLLNTLPTVFCITRLSLSPYREADKQERAASRYGNYTAPVPPNRCSDGRDCCRQPVF